MLLDGASLLLEGLVDRLGIGVGNVYSASGLLYREALLMDQPAELLSLLVR